SAGTTLTSSAGTPSSSATSCAYFGSFPSASVVRLSTILPVGWTRRKTARYASFAIAALLRLGGCQPLALLVRRQRIVLLEIAERRLGAALRMRRRRRPVAARVDADLDLRLTHRSPTPASCCPCSARGRWASRRSCRQPAWRSPTDPPRRPARHPRAAAAPTPRRRSPRRPRPAP